MSYHQDKFIVVTGGAGLIGSAVIRELNNRGIDNIIVIERLGESESWKNLVGKQFDNIFEVNQCFQVLEKRKEQIGGIIHLGACSSTVEKNASFLLQNNTKFSQELCGFALQNGIRFVYASSAATYGDGSNGFSDDHDLLEDLQPLNMYGYSKHLFDLWAKRRGYLSQITGLKYFNVFGPNEYHKGRMSSVVLSLVPQIKESQTVQLFQSSDPEKYADGGQMRDFIYVKDAARMTVDFLFNEIGGIHNIGRGTPETWNTLASAVFKALDVEENIEYIPMPEDLLGKYQNYTCADMSKFQQSPELNPATHSIEDAVVDYVRNYILEEATW